MNFQKFFIDDCVSVTYDKVNRGILYNNKSMISVNGDLFKFYKKTSILVETEFFKSDQYPGTLMISNENPISEATEFAYEETIRLTHYDGEHCGNRIRNLTYKFYDNGSYSCRIDYACSYTGYCMLTQYYSFDINTKISKIVCMFENELEGMQKTYKDNVLTSIKQMSRGDQHGWGVDYQGSIQTLRIENRLIVYYYPCKNILRCDWTDELKSYMAEKKTYFKKVSSELNQIPPDVVQICVDYVDYIEPLKTIEGKNVPNDVCVVGTVKYSVNYMQIVKE